MTAIRPIAPRDEADWLRLWKAYLAFYKKTDLPEGHAEKLFNSLVAGEPWFAFVAEKGGELVGFVHALPHPSTWSATGYCYLEDLFVDASARGAGAGRVLINAVHDEAKRRELSLVYWQTERDNKTARKLYDKVATLSDFVQYRMD